MIKVTGHIDGSHYKTVLSNARHELIGDEPKSSGGTELGFSPSELLCSALAACTCATLRMYADRKQWSLEQIDVTITMQKDLTKNITSMEREIQLIGNLTDEQRSRLLEIAEQCPIHKILTNPIEIQTILK
jgi:putative redox protein